MRLFFIFLFFLYFLFFHFNQRDLMAIIDAHNRLSRFTRKHISCIDVESVNRDYTLTFSHRDPIERILLLSFFPIEGSSRRTRFCQVVHIFFIFLSIDFTRSYIYIYIILRNIWLSDWFNRLVRLKYRIFFVYF